MLSLFSGKILESLKATSGGDLNSRPPECSGASANGSANNESNSQEEPPTPPHTPQRDLSQGLAAPGQEGSSRNSHLGFDPVQHQAIQARVSDWLT